MTALGLLGWIALAVLLQMLAGIAVAILRRPLPRTDARRSVQRGQPAPAWEGWRAFRVENRAFEDIARTQCSFTLVPEDGVPLPLFKPGQFLTFSLAGAGTDRVVRCYSLSDSPDPARYRITVKRAVAPPARPDAPPGVASTWLHDKAKVGDLLQVRAPAGLFVLPPDPAPDPVFVAGGIGITPMIPMLKAALAAGPGRPVHLFHGVRDGSDQAFKPLLEDLARAHPAFHLHVLYAEPRAEDVQGRDFVQPGFITLDLMQRTLPHGRHAFYICGPDAMMAALIPALTAWGVPGADIHRESFGPASAAPAPAALATPGPALAISFRRSGRTLAWTGQDASLLDFAERNGIAVESGCHSGSCGTCETRLVSGRVGYRHRPDHDIAPGCCLLCAGTPETALELEA